MDKNYLKAAQLAFSLKQPGRLLSIVSHILVAEPRSAGVEPLGRLVRGFSQGQVATALQFICDWNATARHCHAAQALLHALLVHSTPAVRTFSTAAPLGCCVGL